MSPEMQAVPSPRPGVIVSTKKEVINDVQIKPVSIFFSIASKPIKLNRID